MLWEQAMEAEWEAQISQEPNSQLPGIYRTNRPWDPESCKKFSPTQILALTLSQKSSKLGRKTFHHSSKINIKFQPVRMEYFYPKSIRTVSKIWSLLIRGKSLNLHKLVVSHLIKSYRNLNGQSKITQIMKSTISKHT